MIESLTLTDIGVIADADVDLGPGLTVITGETGAGKTMVLTGLGLLWGQRADPQRVRSGATASRVEGVVQVRDPAVREAVDAVLADTGAEWDDDGLIIARSVTAQGRSRAYVGGRTVPAAVLARVAEHLVAVHGQDDQFRLLQGTRQRSALDQFAGSSLREALLNYQQHYTRLRDAIRERQNLVQRSNDHAVRHDDIRHLVDEIEKVKPTEGELARLAAEADQLRHAEELAAAAQVALTALRGGTDESLRMSADEAVSLAKAALSRVDHHHSGLQAINTELTGVQQQLNEIALSLASLGAELRSDPARLSVIEDRRAALGAVLRHFRAYTQSVDATETSTLAWLVDAQTQLMEIDGAGEKIAELDASIERFRAAASTAAANVTAIRRQAAQELSAAVTAELTSLAMPRARLDVQITGRPPGEGLLLHVDGEMMSADKSGCDDVVFAFATRPEEEVRPLHRGVSGGERSRIMLAVEVVLAHTHAVPTLIFDEVDAGIGGRAAIEVGRRLARLARYKQVLVVTHLPQVAAFATTHLVVRPGADGQVTEASVAIVDATDRHRELARMLSGLDESESGVAHAQELLDLAQAEWTP